MKVNMAQLDPTIGDFGGGYRWSGGSVAATGGNSGAGGTATSTPSTAAGSSGGCSCRMAGARTTDFSGFALLALVMFATRIRKRR